jgi:hypothetical protein
MDKIITPEFNAGTDRLEYGNTDFLNTHGVEAELSGHVPPLLP